MILVKVRSDFRPALALTREMQRQVPFATAAALTRTAQHAAGAVQAEMSRVFDRPTRYTLNATRVRPATKSSLAAQVWLKDRGGSPAAKDTHYLWTQVFGGRRGRKGYETALLRAGVLRSNEFTVPASDLPLDANGNIPIGMLRSMLSQLKAAEPYSGFSANRTDSKRSKRTVARAGTYFVPRPGTLPRGVYQRKRTGFGWATRMVLKIVVGRPRYRSRLSFFQIGERVAAQYFPFYFDQALQQAIASSR